MVTKTVDCAAMQVSRRSRAPRSACRTFDTVKATVPGARANRQAPTGSLQSASQTSVEPRVANVTSPMTGSTSRSSAAAATTDAASPRRASTGVRTRASSSVLPATFEKNRSRSASGKCQTSSAHVIAIE